MGYLESVFTGGWAGSQEVVGVHGGDLVHQRRGAWVFGIGDAFVGDVHGQFFVPFEADAE